MLLPFTLACLVRTQVPVPLVDAQPAPDPAPDSAPVTEQAQPLPQATGVSPVPLVTVSPPPLPPPIEEDAPLPWFGVGLDLGVPVGIGLNVELRPLPWLRLHGGPAYNIIAPGGRGGVTVGWFPSVFTPTLTLEGGGFAEGDATSIVGNFAKLSVLGAGAAKQFNYGFGSVLLGVEVGTPTFTFFARGGVSYLAATLHGFQAALRTSTNNDTITAEDPSLTAVLASFQVGAMVFFR